MNELLIVKMDAVTLKNLKVFMERVDLKGAEVGEFYNIIKALSEAEPEMGGGEDSE